jgi:hypothetical protein
MPTLGPGGLLVVIKGDKVTSKINSQMESQLHDKDTQKCLTEQEVWTENQFEEIDWTSYETAFKRMERSIQTSIAKVCQNMWHIGVKHKLYYHEPHP